MAQTRDAVIRFEALAATLRRPPCQCHGCPRCLAVENLAGTILAWAVNVAPAATQQPTGRCRRPVTSLASVFHLRTSRPHDPEFQREFDVLNASTVQVIRTLGYEVDLVASGECTPQESVRVLVRPTG